jgi:hypothetical protein
MDLMCAWARCPIAARKRLQEIVICTNVFRRGKRALPHPSWSNLFRRLFAYASVTTSAYVSISFFGTPRALGREISRIPPASSPSQPRVICPTGKSVASRKNGSTPWQKNNALVPSGKSNPLIVASRSSKGRFAIVTDVGRDAVDAAVPMKRAALIADGRIVWSWRPDAGSSWRKKFRRRRWQESPVTGESTK